MVRYANGEAFPGLEGSRVRTVSRALTMSYHPGMLMPKFCRSLSYQSDRHEELGSHTTVIGIVGALGNMNLTSSNFPLRRQFSANPILRHCISVLYQANRWVFGML